MKQFVSISVTGGGLWLNNLVKNWKSEKGKEKLGRKPGICKDRA